MRGFDQRWRQLLAASRQAQAPLCPPPPQRRWPLRPARSQERAERWWLAIAAGCALAAWALAIRCWPLASGTAPALLAAPPSIALSQVLPPPPHPPSPVSLWSLAIASLTDASHPAQDPHL
jgi:hypothetical protein